MLGAQRLRSLQLLAMSRPDDVLLCRETEARCHAESNTPHEYADQVRRAAFNLRENAALDEEVVQRPDATLTEGTLLGRIESETKARAERFDQMLHEKYEAINEGKFKSIVRCRRCGSSEVTYEEKQTRSADEAASLFFSCTKCKNRWVTR